MQIYDTTLRDGTQGEGISLSVTDKLQIARILDELGVDYIEGGWPGSNPKDMDFFVRAQDELSLQRARITAFGSTRRKDTDPARDDQLQLLLQARTSTVTLFGKSSELHVQDVLRTSLRENLRMIEDSVRFLQAEGREVVYDAEHFFDGYAADAEYALATLESAVTPGCRLIVLCDTNGGRMPWEIAEAVQGVRTHFGLAPSSACGQAPASDPFVLGIHAHNDSAVGVANTLAAVRAGATHVQGTINGYGERCGNADLISVIANLQLKLDMQVLPAAQLARLTELSRLVSELANMSHASDQPYVGASAFAHKGGTHVNAVVKNVATYQHIEPRQVGNQTRVLVSELSGKDNIAVKSREYGLQDLSREQERAVLSQIKDLENSGFAFEAADASVDLLLRRTRPDYAKPFELIDFTSSVEHRLGRGLLAEAVVKVKIGEQVFHEAGDGNGPVNALDNALRKALLQFYPELDRVRLIDYKVRILDSHAATAAGTRVLITSTDGDSTWSTVGASPNIIEASWIALADSLEYFLLRSTS